MGVKDYNNPFPSNLRELMKENNENQETLGKVIGKQRQTVSLYQTGESKPDCDTVRKIAEHYGVTTDWLLGVPNSVKTRNGDKQKVLDYTGLSEKALDNITNHFKGLEYLNEMREYFKPMLKNFGDDFNQAEYVPIENMYNLKEKDKEKFQEYSDQYLRYCKLPNFISSLNTLLESSGLEESVEQIGKAFQVYQAREEGRNNYSVIRSKNDPIKYAIFFSAGELIGLSLKKSAECLFDPLEKELNANDKGGSDPWQLLMQE